MGSEDLNSPNYFCFSFSAQSISSPDLMEVRDAYLLEISELDCISEDRLIGRRFYCSLGTMEKVEDNFEREHDIFGLNFGLKFEKPKKIETLCKGIGVGKGSHHSRGVS